MSLKDRMTQDIWRVYMNQKQFAELHQWGDQTITCVIDNETAWKRKNNNVVDISYDPNTNDLMLFVPKSEFAEDRIPEPQHEILFDRNLYNILSVDDNAGMLGIMLTRRGAATMT